MIHLDMLPSYIRDLDEADLLRAENISVEADRIRSSITTEEIDEIKNLFNVENPIDEELTKKINSLYKKLNKDCVSISILFLECYDYLSFIGGQNKKINLYISQFKDLRYLRQLVSDYSNNSFKNKNSLYMITNLVNPYLNSMISLIHFTNRLLNLFSKGIDQTQTSPLQNLMKKYGGQIGTTNSDVAASSSGEQQTPAAASTPASNYIAE